MQGVIAKSGRVRASQCFNNFIKKILKHLFYYIFLNSFMHLIIFITAIS